MIFLLFLFSFCCSIDINPKNSSLNETVQNLLIIKKFSLEDQNFQKQIPDKKEYHNNLVNDQKAKQKGILKQIFFQNVKKFRKFLKHLTTSPIPDIPPISSQDGILGTSQGNTSIANIDPNKEKGMIFGIPNSIFGKVNVIDFAIIVTLLGLFVLYLACKSARRHVAAHYSDDPLLVEPADSDDIHDFP